MTDAPDPRPSHAPPRDAAGSRELPAFAAGHDLTPDHLARHAAVVLDGITAGYDERVALEDVSVAIPAGSLLAVFGPNGGGKSTLLKVIAGLLAPWQGTVTVLGARPRVHARRVAYVPQAEQVDWDFPVTCWDVVAMGRYPSLGPFRGLRAVDREAVGSALRIVGMADHARTQIGRLSGGQRRRVFLARALAAEPDLYLLDEPVTGVDPTTQEDLMEILVAEAARGRTVVATTHDLAAAAEHFRQVLAVNRTVIAHGASSLVLDEEVLARTYGGHLLVLGGSTVLLDDAHHHDESPRGEQHFHEGDPGAHR
jgi:ABC-type Mn2+/Zn2+ transport system ATPase subunit